MRERRSFMPKDFWGSRMFFGEARYCSLEKGAQRQYFSSNELIYFLYMKFHNDFIIKFIDNSLNFFCQDLKLAHGGLKVICVGSVWESWKFMKNGFVNEIHDTRVVDELSLLRLMTTSALGACYLAAEKINVPFVKPYESNVEIFFHYKRDNYLETRTTELKNHTLISDNSHVHENGEST